MYGIFRGQVKLANQIHNQVTYKRLATAQKHADDHEKDRLLCVEWAKVHGKEIAERWTVPVVAAQVPTE